jgi:adenylate cyclase
VDLDIGIGIDAGQIAMGLVGRLHLEPTVIGDAVNVAQRLETLTKDLKRRLILSENVRERLQEEVEAEFLEEVTVRGRETPLRVYGMGGPIVTGSGPEQSTDLAGKEKTE